MGSQIRSATIFASALSVAFLFACYPRPDTQQTIPTLRDVEIASDFTFATTRSVALTVRADKGSTGSESAALEVARPDGKILFRGPIHGDRPLTLDLNVPTKDAELRVKLSANGKADTKNISIISDMAMAAF